MSGFFYYFAYDADMHPAQLAVRAQSFEAVGTGYLSGYELRFDKRSAEPAPVGGTGNARRTEAPGDEIYGAIYRVATRDRSLLQEADRADGGYEVVNTRIQTNGRTILACMRVARDDWIDETLVPFDWYVALVSSGARIQGLPAGYQRMLRRVRSVQDPNEDRAKAGFRLARKGDLIIPFPRKPSDR